MKTALVTGANGFIGSALTKSLEQGNFKVLKFDLDEGDIAETGFIERYKKARIDYVFHLAGKTFVPDSWEKPVEFYKTAVLGTAQVLDLCRDKRIPLTFISAYLYGIQPASCISESNKCKPNNPYAHSKYLAEELCRFYSMYYKTKVVIVRPFNVYGKNHNSVFLIPHIIKQVLECKTISVKDLKPRRDYLYLDDLISGIVKTINVKASFSIFNFGSGKSLSVEEIIEIIQKVAGTNKQVQSEKKERENEIADVVADISKAKKELNWRPKFSFKQGIAEILKEEFGE